MWLHPVGGWITAPRSLYYFPSECVLLPLGGWITAPQSVNFIPEMLLEETETFLRKNITIGCFRRQNSSFIEFISQHWPVSLKQYQYAWQNSGKSVQKFLRTCFVSGSGSGTPRLQHYFQVWFAPPPLLLNVKKLHGKYLTFKWSSLHLAKDEEGTNSKSRPKPAWMVCSMITDQRRSFSIFTCQAV